ncbi:MAG TPA: prepilin-type N-terminal cleavage/methylation domain-containing protein [Candidatus Deferrimicrobium sp.]|nr:prepilin-type N-terminal cleavage/methylation domain-containing protein [Candidatus Deferrimicrobium sp.]
MPFDLPHRRDVGRVPNSALRDEKPDSSIFRAESEHGFGLIELCVVIIVVGIMAAVAMQSMTVLVEDSRRAGTQREMEMLAEAIVGDPELLSGQGGQRSDFGYVGDVGAFPPDLDALTANPGGYATWDGPYIALGFAEDSVGFKTDEWGTDYAYTGGITITSTGSGATLTKKIADAASDYLLNTVRGTIRDSNDSLPGSVKGDSVDIAITIPNGSGSTDTKTYHPDSAGLFALDSLPVGQHEVRVIYAPQADTLFRYVTVLPRHKGTLHYHFAAPHFAGGNCAGADTITLRPMGVGSLTELVAEGAAANWDCVKEVTTDDDVTRVKRSANTYANDVYALADPSFDPCPIVSVTVYCRARKAQSVGNLKPTIVVNGTQYSGSEQSLTASYGDYYQQWTTNPYTGVAWTWQNITDLEAGVSLQGQNVNFPAYCTQVWVEVAYGP